MTEDSPRYANLRDYLRVLAEHRMLLILCALAAAAGAFYISGRQHAVYAATAKLSFADETANLSLLGTPVAPGSNPDQTPTARAETIDEPRVLSAVQRALRTSVSAGVLGGEISTSLEKDSQLVDVTSQSRDAMFAARLVNEFAKQAAASTNAKARARFSGAANVLRGQLRSLGRSPTDQGIRFALADQITRLEFLRANAEPGKVVALAGTRGGQVSPKPVRDSLLAALAGLLLGLLLAFLRDSLDRRLKSWHEIETELPYPLLGQVSVKALGKAVRPDEAAAEKYAADVEAFRIVRQNLEFLDRDRGLRVVAVTSAVAEEGKSTVAASLALACCVMARRILLVECDLRRPELAKRLGLQSAPGLADFLSGAAAPEEVLQQVRVGAPSPSVNGAKAERSGVALPDHQLVCITAGSRTSQPAELLKSERLATFLDEVSNVYDLVILDCSPLLPVADTRELLPRVDGIVLCVRSAQTSREQAGALRSTLELFPPRPTGIVVTGLRPRDAADYGFYPYTYSYTS